MRGARVGMIGLGLLLAALPGSALAERANTPVGKMSKLHVDCDQAASTAGWRFKVWNQGDQTGDFRVTVRLLDEDTGERQKINIGKITLEPSEERTFEDEVSFSSNPRQVKFSAEIERTNTDRFGDDAERTKRCDKAPV